MVELMVAQTADEKVDPWVCVKAGLLARSTAALMAVLLVLPTAATKAASRVATREYPRAVKKARM